MGIFSWIQNFREKRANTFKTLKSDDMDEVTSLLSEMVDEYQNHYDSSRFETKVIKIKNVKTTVFYYTFNNGRILKIGGEKFILVNKKRRRKTEYNVNNSLKNDIIELLNKLINKFNKERDPYREAYRERTYERSYYTENESYSNPKPKPTKKNASHPKREKYDTLVDTIKNRRINYDKLKKNDPDRTTKRNELNTAIRMAKTMKLKYNF